MQCAHPASNNGLILPSGGYFAQGRLSGCSYQHVSGPADGPELVLLRHCYEPLGVVVVWDAFKISINSYIAKTGVAEKPSQFCA